MTDLLWQPSEQRVADANLTAFLRFLAQEMDDAPSDFTALRDWSVDRPEAFWPAFWRFTGH